MKKIVAKTFHRMSDVRLIHLFLLEDNMNTDNKEKDSTLNSNKKNEPKETEPCMRCSAPVEIEGDLLCRKCEGEVH